MNSLKKIPLTKYLSLWSLTQRKCSLHQLPSQCRQWIHSAEKDRTGHFKSKEFRRKIWWNWKLNISVTLHTVGDHRPLDEGTQTHCMGLTRKRSEPRTTHKCTAALAHLPARAFQLVHRQMTCQLGCNQSSRPQLFTVTGRWILIILILNLTD